MSLLHEGDQPVELVEHIEVGVFRAHELLQGGVDFLLNRLSSDRVGNGHPKIHKVTADDLVGERCRVLFLLFLSGNLDNFDDGLPGLESVYC